MIDKFRLFRLLINSALLAVVLNSAGAGCTEDSDCGDDMEEDDTGSDADSDTDADTDTDTDVDTDADADTDTDSDTDADTDDYDREPGNVKEGEECRSPAMFHVMKGVCKKPTDECEGGYPDALKYKRIFPEEITQFISFLPTPGVGPLPDPPERNADCDKGLVCCINTDECGRFKQEFGSWPGIDALYNISCTNQRACFGLITNSINLGCPEDKRCCFRNI